MWKKYSKGKTDEAKRKRIYRYGEDAVIALDTATVCDLCGRAEKLVIDHCHKTSAFRGVLCNSCNIALGLLRDDPALLRKAATYVEVQRNEIAA
jgi:hypothetical protein